MSSIPTLSIQGHLKDPVGMADYLLGCFYVSQYSQSNALLGGIQSLPYLILKSTGNGGVDPVKLVENTETSLKVLFRSWFDSVNISVSYETDPNNESVFNIIIKMGLVKDGVDVRVGRSLNIDNSRLKYVNDLLTNNIVKYF